MRLIDADKLKMTTITRWNGDVDFVVYKEELDNAPTVIAEKQTEQTDGDLISRKQAVDKMKELVYSNDELSKMNEIAGWSRNKTMGYVIQYLNELPSAEKTAEKPIKHFGSIECPNCGRLLMLEEQTYGWCKGCKEYDTEKHCCHRYSSFIRESLQDSINAVLEDIKADIAEEICLTDNPYTKQTEYTISHKKVLEIIDNHISGKEKEKNDL